jgi:hypothetical protein
MGRPARPLHTLGSVGQLSDDPPHQPANCRTLISPAMPDSTPTSAASYTT